MMAKRPTEKDNNPGGEVRTPWDAMRAWMSTYQEREIKLDMISHRDKFI